MNIWGYEKKLQRIKERIKQDGRTPKLVRLKLMYERLIKKERDKKYKKGKDKK